MKKKILMFCCLCAFLLFYGCGGVDEVAQKMIDDIDSIGTVSIDDEGKIDKLLTTYSSLTDKQKEQVSNYTVLLEAQDKIDELKELQEKLEEEERKKNAPSEQDKLVLDAIKRIQATLIKRDSMELRRVQLAVLTYKADGTEIPLEDRYIRVKISYSAMNKAGGYTSENSILGYEDGKFDGEIINESDDDGWRHVYEISNTSFSGESKQCVLTEYDLEKIEKWLAEEY